MADRVGTPESIALNMCLIHQSGDVRFTGGVVYIDARQRIPFNAGSAILERVTRGWVDDSSKELTFLLQKYVLFWTAEDAFDAHGFHPPRDLSNVCFDVPMIRELVALVRAQVEALDFKRNH